MLVACLVAAAFAQCPEDWNAKKCLGSSGQLATDPQLPYVQEKIVWHAGMTGHSHYTIDPKKTALFVIDPQNVYAKCPEVTGEPTVENLIQSPSAEGFKGHSPLCCEKFYPCVERQNKLAEAARAKGMPVFLHAHVYRDTDGDGKVDNCGGLCDFDVLGWAGWPEAWNLWNAAMPWHEMAFAPKDAKGFLPDREKDYYAEKSTFSAMTEPVVKELRALGVDTVVITGFMTQYCSVTTSRHAHDLGFKVVYVQDANDGPLLQELLSGIDENAAVPFHLGIAVVDVIKTDEFLANLEGSKQEL